MSTVEVKTADLIGPALDWAVGIAVEGCCIRCGGNLPRWKFDMLEASVWPEGVELGDIERYSPSKAWSDGGPLIELFHIQTSFNGCGFSRSPTGEYWCAYVCKDTGDEIRPSGGGPTPLIAACRAIVQAKLGETVKIPAELA